MNIYDVVVALNTPPIASEDKQPLNDEDKALLEDLMRKLATPKGTQTLQQMVVNFQERNEYEQCIRKGVCNH